MGIWVSLESAGSLDALEVVSDSAGWRADVYVSTEPGQALGDWGERVATVEGATAGTTTVDLDGRDGGAVLLWLTDVGQDHRAEIAELRVLA